MAASDEWTTTALAVGPTLPTAARDLDGLAGGMVTVSINTAIGQAYPERLRPRVLALMSTCWIIPSLVGPPPAGLVAEWWSWRAVFFGLAALTILPALVVAVMRSPSWAAAPVPSDDRSPRPALMVATAVSLGAALGQYGVSGRNMRHLLFTAGGFALLAAFASRLLPPGTWRAARGLSATVLLRGLGSGVFFTLEAYVPLVLATERDAPPMVIGLAFTGAAVAWAGSSLVQGRLLEHCPRHRLVVAGALVQAVAVALALAVAVAVAVAVAGTLPSTPAYTVASAMVVAAVGMGMYAPSLTVLSLTHSPPGRQGYASSAMQTTQNLGQIMVLGVSSALFNACLGAGSTDATGYGAAFGLLLAPCALATVLAHALAAPSSPAAQCRSGPHHALAYSGSSPSSSSSRSIRSNSFHTSVPGPATRRSRSSQSKSLNSLKNMLAI
ncbi:MFS transporter [Streptomyces inhibens]|uniref:MFS transporter n=1 Tax=Streptomyces inhibens TaxID=2293571 RepID=UPI0037B24B7C